MLFRLQSMRMQGGLPKGSFMDTELQTRYKIAFMVYGREKDLGGRQEGKQKPLPWLCSLSFKQVKHIYKGRCLNYHPFEARSWPRTSSQALRCGANGCKEKCYSYSSMYKRTQRLWSEDMERVWQLDPGLFLRGKTAEKLWWKRWG